MILLAGMKSGEIIFFLLNKIINIKIKRDELEN